MPKEKNNLLISVRSADEIHVNDQVLVRSAVFGNEPCLAQVIEIKQTEHAHISPVVPVEEKEEGEVAVEDLQKNGTSNLPEPGAAANVEQPSTESAETSGTNISFGMQKEDECSKTLYYVHYIGTDRRLDEWVDKERIVPTTEATDLNGNPATPIVGQFSSGKSFITRSQRRLNEDFLHMPKSFEDMDAYTRKLEMEHEQRTKVKNVDKVQFGEWEIDAWYFSPFPLSMVINKSKLFFCEFCLWYTSDQMAYSCHMLHLCKAKLPPGQIIYEEENLSVWAVEGRKHKNYCQSLCLLSKLFLDHKTLYYDVEGFIFYVLCEVGERGEAHTVGHFSKELYSSNNLACIMVLPPYQRSGYGKLLIQISYCLSEREGIIGTPEKPLSDLGKVSYRSYWWWVLVGVLDRELGSGRIEAGNISVNELSRLSGIHVEDIVETFKTLQLIKYWRGDHVVRISRKIITQIKQLHLFRPPKLILKKAAVRWTPNNRQQQQGAAENADDGDDNSNQQKIPNYE